MKTMKKNNFLLETHDIIIEFDISEVIGIYSLGRMQGMFNRGVWATHWSVLYCGGPPTASYLGTSWIIQGTFSLRLPLSHSTCVLEIIVHLREN
jgi:hypothetical protein